MSENWANIGSNNGNSPANATQKWNIILDPQHFHLNSRSVYHFWHVLNMSPQYRFKAFFRNVANRHKPQKMKKSLDGDGPQCPHIHL